MDRLKGRIERSFTAQPVGDGFRTPTLVKKSFLAFVLLESGATLNGGALAAALRARHPKLEVEVAGGATAGIRQSSEKSLVIRVGDQLVAVMSMPVPIPQDSGLWSRTTTAWPEAPVVAARHRGHLVISEIGQDQKPLPTARLMTAVIGALIATMPQSCAVVWDGKIARPTDLWLHLSAKAYAPFPDYPFPLWVDVLPFRSAQGIGSVTMGLSAFVDREIEFKTSRLALPALIEKMAGLIVYLIEHGRVLSDGDTFGGDPEERIAVRFKNSDQFNGMPVFLCTDGSS